MAINGRSLLGGAAAVTVAALVAACGGTDPGPAGAASPVPSTSPAPTFLTDAQYVAELVVIDKPVSAALAKLARSGSKADMEATARAASTAAAQVRQLAAPEGASTDNAALAADLTVVDDDLTALGSGSGGANTCAAANPAVAVGKASAITELAAEVKTLATDGWPTGLTVPKFPKQQNRSLSTGTFLRNTDRSGNGRLTIENGSSGSAVVTLKRNGARSFAVYLRKNGKFTVKGVRDGSYTVYFATGSDWDAKHKGFTTDCDYEKFDKALKFTTKYSSSYVEYTTYTISLYGVLGGTASTSDVPPDQFPTP
jgi:hypothetical protein